MRSCRGVGGLLVACAVAAPAAAAPVVTLTEHANRTTVAVHVGDRLVVRLPANASTGYEWRFTSTGGPLLRLLSARYLPAPRKAGPPIVGAPGTFIAQLAVQRIGRSALTLAYLRDTHPPTPPAQRFTVTIIATSA